MTKGMKISKTGEKNYDVLKDGLIISERIYKNMRYTSAILVNVFPYNNNKNNNECLAIGFPTVLEVKTLNTIDIDKTGYTPESYECINISHTSLLKQNWQGYIMYFHDKTGKYFLQKKNYFYEVKFLYPTSGQNTKTILIRKLNKDWAKNLGVDIIYSLDTSDFYTKALDKILKSATSKNLLSKNIKSFKISTNSYPTFKMRVLLDYGVYGGNNEYGRKKVVENKAENFEMNWVVLPMN